MTQKINFNINKYSPVSLLHVSAPLTHYPQETSHHLLRYKHVKIVIHIILQLVLSIWVSETVRKFVPLMYIIYFNNEILMFTGAYSIKCG
jgi:hypothetical protein